MIDFKSHSELYSDANDKETLEAADKFIEDIRFLAVKSSEEKYQLGLELIKFFESKTYSSKWHDKAIVNEIGYHLDKNVHANIFFAVCDVEFGFEKSVVSRLMNVVDEFGNEDKETGLQEKYKSFKWSILAEMLSMKPEERELITPDMTVRLVREEKKRLKKLIATSQRDKEDEKTDPVECIEEPERFKKLTRLQLIDYILKLEKQVGKSTAQSKGKKGGK